MTCECDSALVCGEVPKLDGFVERCTAKEDVANAKSTDRAVMSCECSYGCVGGQVPKLDGAVF